jgi:hypothetical protein
MLEDGVRFYTGTSIGCSSIVLFLCVSLTCEITSDHKQRKESCHNMCHLQFLAMLATAASPPVVAEAGVEVAVAVAEVVNGG